MEKISYKRIDDYIRGIWSSRCNVCGKKKDPQEMMTVNECVKCFAESHGIEGDDITETPALDGMPLSSVHDLAGRSTAIPSGIASAGASFPACHRASPYSLGRARVGWPPLAE
jgi:hypothetical protein